MQDLTEEMEFELTDWLRGNFSIRRYGGIRLEGLSMQGLENMLYYKANKNQ